MLFPGVFVAKRSAQCIATNIMHGLILVAMHCTLRLILEVSGDMFNIYNPFDDKSTQIIVSSIVENGVICFVVVTTSNYFLHYISFESNDHVSSKFASMHPPTVVTPTT